MVQLSHPFMTKGKSIALTRWTFVSKVMSPLLKMLFRLDIAFLLRSKRLLISWLQSLSTVILEHTYNQSYGFSSSHVEIWELYHKEGWVLKNWCFRTVVLGKTLESPLDCKEIKPASPKGNQPWIFIGRTDAEVLILWLSDEKSRLTGKDPNDGKDWR